MDSQDCSDHDITQFLLSQTQQQVEELQQENEKLQQKIENLQDKLSWRRIKKLSSEVEAGRQRFREAKMAAISALSEILSDFDPPETAEAASLKRVFSVALDEIDDHPRKKKYVAPS